MIYDLRLGSAVDPFDKIFDVGGIKVVIDLKSGLYLKGTVIDHVNALVGGGFDFTNPNASKSCSCGTSFSA